MSRRDAISLRMALTILKLVMGRDGGDHDSTENLVVYVPVQMFHQLPVGESDVCLQDHKGDLCGRTESVPASQAPVRQAAALRLLLCNLLAVQCMEHGGCGGRFRLFFLAEQA